MLAFKLEKRGLRVRRQVLVSIVYEGIRFEEGFRADLIVENEVIVELKSVESGGSSSQEATVDVPATSRQTARFTNQFRRCTHKGRNNPSSK